MEEYPAPYRPQFPQPPPPPLWRRVLLFLRDQRDGVLMGFILGAILVAIGVEQSLSAGSDADAGASRTTRVLPESAAPGGIDGLISQPVPSVLEVYSIPTGAQVSLGAEVIGTTPLWLNEVSSGTHTLTVVAEGHLPLDTTVAVDAGQAISLVLLLSQGESRGYDARPIGTPSPESSSAAAAASSTPSTAPSASPRTSSMTGAAPAQAGTLAINVRPWGTILIDGVIHARETDVRYETTLPVGVHRVRAVHPLLGSHEATVRIRPDATTYLEMDLNQAPTTTSSGN